MTTDSNNSYTVFTYQCGELNWGRGLQQASQYASIGFSAGPNLFANHPLSRQPNVNDIACDKQTCSPWTNVVYRINGEYFVQCICNYVHVYAKNVSLILHAALEWLCSSYNSLPHKHLQPLHAYITSVWPVWSNGITLSSCWPKNKIAAPIIIIISVFLSSWRHYRWGTTDHSERIMSSR